MGGREGGNKGWNLTTSQKGQPWAGDPGDCGQREV